MKKLIGLSLALVLALALMACGVQNSSTTQSNIVGGSSNATTEEQSQTTTAPETEQETQEETPPADSGESAVESETDDQKDGTQSDTEETEEDAVSFSASHSDVTLKAAGNSFRLTVTGNRDEYVVTYSSEDETIAVVDEDGRVTAVAPGNTLISMHVRVTDGSAQIEYDFACIVRCNWTEEEEGSEEEIPSETPTASVDLAAFFASYMESMGENAPFMMAAEGEILDAFYAGLSAISCKQSVVQMAAMSAVPFEFALIELENAGDVEAIRAILQSRVDYQADGGAWYPETIAAWEKAEIIVKGNFVAMIVAGEQQTDAVAAFNALFG